MENDGQDYRLDLSERGMGTLLLYCKLSGLSMNSPFEDALW